MSVARVSNIPAVIRELKDAGIWVYGASAQSGSNLWQTDFSGAVCLVIGSEGDGMGRLVSESCDALVSIPLRGELDSLNASCAAAVMMYEVLRQRG